MHVLNDVIQLCASTQFTGFLWRLSSVQLSLAVCGQMVICEEQWNYLFGHMLKPKQTTNSLNETSGGIFSMFSLGY